MGGVYLTYSAYFLSNGFDGVRMFMLAVMVLMYLVMGIVNCRSLYQCLKVIKGVISENSQNNLNDAGFMMP
jgi:hypothetical protein